MPPEVPQRLPAAATGSQTASRRPSGGQKARLPGIHQDARRFPGSPQEAMSEFSGGSKAPRKPPEVPRGSQRVPGGSQKLPDALRGLQRRPEAPRAPQRFPEARRGSQRLPEAPIDPQRHPEAPRGHQNLPEAPRGSQRLPEARRGSQEAPRVSQRPSVWLALYESLAKKNSLNPLSPLPLSLMSSSLAPGWPQPGPSLAPA